MEMTLPPDPDRMPITETSLAAYFRDRLAHCARRLKPPPQEDTCWYIGTVLDRFVRSDQFFAYEQGKLTVRPLALLYKDALEAPTERDRCLLLQQLGDQSLFLGALFPERFAKRGIRQDYFVGMGGGAYDYLAGNALKNRHIFAELAATFARLLDLVARSCSRRQRFSPDDVLALYERWRSTGDTLARRQLEDLGVSLDGAGLQH